MTLKPDTLVGDDMHALRHTVECSKDIDVNTTNTVTSPEVFSVVGDAHGYDATSEINSSQDDTGIEYVIALQNNMKKRLEEETKPATSPASLETPRPRWRR